MFNKSLTQTAMIKRSLVLGYFLLALFSAAFARAEGRVSLPVTFAQYDHESQQILLQGFFTSSCQRFPRVEVASVDNEKGLLKIRVVAKTVGDFCTQIVGGVFDVTVALRNLSIPSDREFLVSIERAAKDISEIPVSLIGDMFVLPHNSIHFTGVLKASSDGYVLFGETGCYSVKSNGIDLSQYVEKVVDISGIEKRFGIQPIISEGSLKASEKNGGFQNTFNGGLPKLLYVVGISSQRL